MASPEPDAAEPDQGTRMVKMAQHGEDDEQGLSNGVIHFCAWLTLA